ncbi:MAG: lactate utilization protein, partial [Synergistaceae bacterium]|nr:lactate utilization protein [Synergistaceae bacterium]
MDKLQSPVRQTNETLGKKICESLIANGYKSAVYVPTAGEACEAAAGMIPDGVSVGVPGTVTVRQIGLMERLEGKRCRVFHHWDPSLTPETRPARLDEENAADWFVTSSNAITFDGKMVNIDGTGNRVAGMAWGHGKLLFIIGMNKAARDLDSALRRARDEATPPNTVRIGMTTPCVKLGYCADCNSPERSCRAVLIL